MSKNSICEDKIGMRATIVPCSAQQDEEVCAEKNRDKERSDFTTAKSHAFKIRDELEKRFQNLMEQKSRGSSRRESNLNEVEDNFVSDYNLNLQLQNLMGSRCFSHPPRGNYGTPRNAILSREHATNKLAIPRKYYQREEKTECVTAVSYFDGIPESVVIKIFSFLQLRHIAKVSRTCSKWRRLACDKILWKKVDMYPYRKIMSESKLIEIIRNRFFGAICALSLKGCIITQNVFRELSKCNTLRSLNLDQCEFVGKFKTVPTEESFPLGLKELHLCCTTGKILAALKSIIPALATVKNFRIADLISGETGDLTEVIKSLPEVRSFYVNNRLNFVNVHIQTIADVCKELKSLTVTHALKWQGEHLDVLVNECLNLEELQFLMTGINDNYLSKVAWERSNITRLSISYCRNVTSAGLQDMTGRLKYLEGFAIASCHDGNAIDDNLMLSIANGDLKYLRHLCLNHSRLLTNDGVLDLLRSKPLSSLQLSDCIKLTPSIINGLQEYGGMFIRINFKSCTKRQINPYLFRCPSFH